VLRRAQDADRPKRLEQALAERAAVLDGLGERTAGGDLSPLSVPRLDSPERHWLLNERGLAPTRAELARAIDTASEDAAELAARPGRPPPASPTSRPRCASAPIDWSTTSAGPRSFSPYRSPGCSTWADAATPPRRRRRRGWPRSPPRWPSRTGS
jgi:hypothetical protein